LPLLAPGEVRYTADQTAIGAAAAGQPKSSG
jgi:hypothetical protein